MIALMDFGVYRLEEGDGQFFGKGGEDGDEEVVDFGGDCRVGFGGACFPRQE